MQNSYIFFINSSELEPVCIDDMAIAIVTNAVCGSERVDLDKNWQLMVLFYYSSFDLSVLIKSGVIVGILIMMGITGMDSGPCYSRQYIICTDYSGTTMSADMSVEPYHITADNVLSAQSNPGLQCLLICL